MDEFKNPWDEGGERYSDWSENNASSLKPSTASDDSFEATTHDEVWNYKLPKRKTVYLSIFYDKGLDQQAAVNLNKELLGQAQYLLDQHNLGLDFLSFDQTPFDFREDVTTINQVLECRQLASNIYDDQVHDPKKIMRLPVINVTATKLPFCGQSFLSTKWLPFVLLYANKTDGYCFGDNSDLATLVHEIGHCAKLHHNKRVKETIIEDIMMTPEPGWDDKGGPFNRVNIYATQVRKIASAYFTH